MSDSISRQEALDAIRPLQTYKLFKGDDMILVDKAKVQTELMMLPPAQPEPKWISVSDRLPEEDGYYIVTDNSGGAAWVVYSFFCRMDDGEPWWEYTNVTAWMEKPSPYQGE